jgi:hypothetical protein
MDPNDAEAPDNPGTAGNGSENIEDNSNNINMISNSYNNRSNNLATVTPHSNTNIPSLSSGLFCSTYKTKIRFDMDLHLFEKHKHDFVYDLSIPVRKASMDDRIEYALELIEQGKIILPDNANVADEM